MTDRHPSRCQHRPHKVSRDRCDVACGRDLCGFGAASCCALSCVARTHLGLAIRVLAAWRCSRSSSPGALAAAVSAWSRVVGAASAPAFRPRLRASLGLRSADGFCLDYRWPCSSGQLTRSRICLCPDNAVGTAPRHLSRCAAPRRLDECQRDASFVAPAAARSSVLRPGIAACSSPMGRFRVHQSSRAARRDGSSRQSRACWKSGEFRAGFSKEDEAMLSRSK